MITVFIKSQAIDVSETVIVAESYNYLKAQFLFTTSDWNGLKKTAYFTQGETSHSIDLDENNIAYPIHLGSGMWSVCVVGKEYKNGELVERITTDSAEITVKPFKVGKDTPFPEILATEAERIEAKIGDLSKLETKNKSDLVGAINEANSKTGGGSTIPEETFANIDANTKARHTHENKMLLDRFGMGGVGNLTQPTFMNRPLAFSDDLPSLTEYTEDILDKCINHPEESVPWNNYFLGHRIIRHFWQKYVIDEIAKVTFREETETIAIPNDDLYIVAENNVQVILMTFAELAEGKEIVAVKAKLPKDDGTFEMVDLRDMVEADGIPYIINGRRTFIHPEQGVLCFGVVTFPRGAGYLYKLAESGRISSIEITYKL